MRRPTGPNHAAADAEPLLAAGSTRVFSHVGEGVNRADGAGKGRQMQAIPGRWRSLTDTRKRIVAREDSP